MIEWKMFIPLVGDNRQSRSVQLLLLVPEEEVLEYVGPDEEVVLVQAAAQQPGQKKRLGPTDWGRLDLFVRWYVQRDKDLNPLGNKTEQLTSDLFHQINMENNPNFFHQRWIPKVQYQGLPDFLRFTTKENVVNVLLFQPMLLIKKYFF